MFLLDGRSNPNIRLALTTLHRQNFYRVGLGQCALMRLWRKGRARRLELKLTRARVCLRKGDARSLRTMIYLIKKWP